MSRNFEQILDELATLKPADFDGMEPNADGIKRLNALMDELLALPQPERGIRAIFDVMERLPESDLGSPGPLVHALEQMRGCYEGELIESIKRKPTLLAIWMVNRILNTSRVPDQQKIYLDLLQIAAQHPGTPVVARHAANNFIAHQTNNGLRRV